MNLLSFFSKKEKAKNESFLALVLSADRVLSLIWDFQDEEIRNLGFGKKSYQNIEVLVHQVAVAIDMAGEQAKVDVSKVVFGLTSDWFEDGELSKLTAKLLKRLSDELDLDPQAFVPLPAAINHLLKIEESTTPNAILIGIFNDFCEVHMLENNSVVKTITSKAQINIEKITKLVAALKEEDKELPAKIIVYGQNESAELSEKIASHNWKDIFIHDPKVDFLDDNELARAVAYAHAADILGFEPTGIEKPTDIKPEEKKPITHNVNELGFVEGEDILLNKPTEMSQATETQEKIEQPGEENKRDSEIESKQDNYAVEPQFENIRPVANQVTQDTPLARPKKKINPLAFLLGIIPDPAALFKFQSGKKIWMIVGAVIILILIAGFVAGFTLTKAEVAIKVNPQTQEEDFSVTAIENSSTDPQKSQLAAKLMTGTADGNQKTTSSGSKKVGDAGRGEINVFNWTTSPKTFSKGTGLITKSGVKFNLDSDIEVASRSASTPGQAKTNAVAQDVGTGGNIDGGTDLSFQQFDAISYSAQAANSFTGGSERQTTVVTKEDMDRLEKSLTDTLTQKAKEDLKSKMQGVKIQDEAVLVKVTKKQFDKKLEEETALLNLDMQIEVNALVYDEQELKKLLAEIIKKNIPENLDARHENIEIADLTVKRQSSSLGLSGKIKAGLVPKFNEEDLKTKIAGKSVKEARAAVLSTGQASDVQINFLPNLPFILSLPRDKSKITFKIETT